jgi:hypothetical protein
MALKAAAAADERLKDTSTPSSRPISPGSRQQFSDAVASIEGDSFSQATFKSSRSSRNIKVCFPSRFFFPSLCFSFYNSSNFDAVASIEGDSFSQATFKSSRSSRNIKVPFSSYLFFCHIFFLPPSSLQPLCKATFFDSVQTPSANPLSNPVALQEISRFV